ncbi:cupin domain-containing protein [Maribacter arcticus]|uniref:Cupin domain protein n=1 Tax=Maribacter arcticus TaxID=561365 RepID=A0A1T5DEA4_9FLAO|nr:cupin domain-containing protein [Maribacter arcticus]SKB70044.1 Cupin domain protein [Maribacter arcticus]
MNSTSFTENLDFNDTKVVIKVLLETSFSKEIRILMKQGQVMKEHKAPFPIIVHILEGEIAFGVEGNVHDLKQGAMLTLEGNVPHDLTAKADSIVRLTLSKQDTADRVKDVVAHS